MSPPAYQRAERSSLGIRLRRWYAARTAQRAILPRIYSSLNKPVAESVERGVYAASMPPCSSTLKRAKARAPVVATVLLKPP